MITSLLMSIGAFLMKENVTDRQREYAHALSKAGADVIIGHNSVIQKLKNIKTHLFL